MTLTKPLAVQQSMSVYQVRVNCLQLPKSLVPTIKNPAYGKQSISRPMRIVAPIPQQGGPRIPKNQNLLKTEKIIQTQKLKNIQKYAKMSDTPFNQRSLIHQEAWFPGGPRIPKNPIFFKRKKSSKTQKLKNFQRYANISDTPFDQRSLIHRKVWFLQCFVRQNQLKNKLYFARRFQTIFKQKISNMRPLLSTAFPQGFRISKNIGHPTLGRGGKKTFKRYLKS